MLFAWTYAGNASLGGLWVPSHFDSLRKSSRRNSKLFFAVTKRHNNDKFQIKNINLCPYFGILILLLKSNFHEERKRTTAILNFPVETSQKFLYTSLKVCPFKKSTFRHLFMCFWMSYNGKSKSFPRKFFIFVISIYLDEIFLSGYEHGLIEKSS